MYSIVDSGDLRISTTRIHKGIIDRNDHFETWNYGNIFQILDRIKVQGTVVNWTLLFLHENLVKITHSVLFI